MANAGDWSELYGVLRVLADGQLAVNSSTYALTVLSVTKPTKNDVRSFRFDGHGNVQVHDQSGKTVARIPAADLGKHADSVKAAIKSKTCGTDPAVARILSLLHLNSNEVKTPPAYPSDIEVEVHDPGTGTTNLLGFNIKSELGGAATLFNASGPNTVFLFEAYGLLKTTNLVYHAVDRINEELTPQLKVQAIEKVATLRPMGLNGPYFEQNLRQVDGDLPAVLAHLTLAYYRRPLTSGGFKTKDLVDYLEVENPLGFDQSRKHRYYEYKIAAFLRESALGMTAQKVWNGGRHVAGTAVVEKTGAMSYYLASDLAAFESKLLAATRIETPDVSRAQGRLPEPVNTLQVLFGRPVLPLAFQVRY